MTTHKAGSRSYGSGTRDPDALKSKTDRPRAGQAEMRQREEVADRSNTGILQATRFAWGLGWPNRSAQKPGGRNDTRFSDAVVPTLKPRRFKKNVAWHRVCDALTQRLRDQACNGAKPDSSNLELSTTAIGVRRQNVCGKSLD